jgi:reductive dehalogenase
LWETNDDFGRFSGANIFPTYRRLKTEREGAGSFEAEKRAAAELTAKWIDEDRPGYGLRDRALYEAAWTVMRSARAGDGILSWNRIQVPTPETFGVEPFRASSEEVATTIKAAARLFGAALVGVSPMKPTYVNQRQRRGAVIDFEDVERPQVTPDRYLIPTRMKWVVSIGVQMDLDLITRIPTALGGAASSLGYSHCAFVVSSLAEFIRGLGYEAIPMVNDTAQSVPFAVEAGLGEMSRTNRIITPEFGPVVRLCKVFTDLPMACDKPIDFGALEFCRRCKKCAEACPAGALSMDDEPSYDVKGPWNNPGHRAWFDDAYKCLRYWEQSTTPCTICFAVCPYTKADRAWIHDAVKAAASIAPAADGVFRELDDAFGYGGQHDAEQWWGENLPAFGIDSTRGTGR